MAQQHKCGQCVADFVDEATYLAHDCPTTGVKPTNPRSMGPAYENIQKAALERTSKRQAKPGGFNKAKQDAAIATLGKPVAEQAPIQ